MTRAAGVRRRMATKIRPSKVAQQRETTPINGTHIRWSAPFRGVQPQPCFVSQKILSISAM